MGGRRKAEADKNRPTDKSRRVHAKNRSGCKIGARRKSHPRLRKRQHTMQQIKVKHSQLLLVIDLDEHLRARCGRSNVELNCEAPENETRQRQRRHQDVSKTSRGLRQIQHQHASSFRKIDRQHTSTQLSHASLAPVALRCLPGCLACGHEAATNFPSQHKCSSPEYISRRNHEITRSRQHNVRPPSYWQDLSGSFACRGLQGDVSTRAWGTDNSQGHHSLTK